MPPKKTTKVPLTIKLRRQGQVYFVSIDDDHWTTISEVKLKLIKLINDNGGLKMNAEPIPLIDIDGEEAGNNIEIPVPSRADNSDDSDSDSVEELVAIKRDVVVKPKEEESSKIDEVTAFDIIIGYFNGGGYSTADNDELLFKVVKDFGELIFCHRKDKGFSISDP